MFETLVIYSDETRYIVALIDLLKVLCPKGSTLSWTILDQEAWGNEEDLERGDPNYRFHVNLNPVGVKLTWNELCAYAKTIVSITYVQIAACTDILLIPENVTEKQLFSQCDIVIEAVDSGYWEIFSKDAGILERLRQSFPYAQTTIRDDSNLGDNGYFR